jgi:hypothetical protein
MDPYLYFSVCTAFRTRNSAISAFLIYPDQSGKGNNSIGSKSAPMRFKELQKALQDGHDRSDASCLANKLPVSTEILYLNMLDINYQ